MASCKSQTIVFARVLLICGLLTAAVPASARKETGNMLYDFCSAGCTDGRYPKSDLILDTAGNLYGTTSAGGSLSNCNGVGCGVVFELSPAAGGTWTETVLYTFCSASNCSDGATPTAGLIFDAAGNLYGTTSAGGSSDCAGGCGTVFELTPLSGRWTEKVLHAFNFKNGAYPLADLIFDSAGNLYSTTELGGAYGNGTVFQLTPGRNRSWIGRVLHSFCPKVGCKDGTELHGRLTFDSAGNLYGTTAKGGGSSICDGGCGTVFQLTPKANGKWTHTVLRTFHGEDGAFPYSGLVFNSGALYGTTSGGGVCIDSCGTVFQLVRGTNGAWTHKVIHKFSDVQTGACPTGDVILDGAGNLYATTSLGGGAFELKSGTNGKWTYKVLYSVDSPTASLIFDVTGHIYGTAVYGTNNFGALFEVSP